MRFRQRRQRLQRHCVVVYFDCDGSPERAMTPVAVASSMESARAMIGRLHALAPGRNNQAEDCPWETEGVPADTEAEGPTTLHLVITDDTDDTDDTDAVTDTDGDIGEVLLAKAAFDTREAAEQDAQERRDRGEQVAGIVAMVLDEMPSGGPRGPSRWA